MLLGAARDEDEARALMHAITATPAAGQSGGHDLQLSANLTQSGVAAPQLYLAVESEDDDDDAPARASRTLASAVLDLQVSFRIPWDAELVSRQACPSRWRLCKSRLGSHECLFIASPLCTGRGHGSERGNERAEMRQSDTGLFRAWHPTTPRVG